MGREVADKLVAAIESRDTDALAALFATLSTSSFASVMSATNLRRFGCRSGWPFFVCRGHLASR
jgi:hypothetical protein